MRYTFVGKNITVTEKLKEQATSKIDKITKLLPEDTEANVKFSTVRQSNTIEVTVPLKMRLLRAEVTATDMYAAIDEVVDILEKQIIKYKGRLHNRAKRNDNFRQEFTAMFADVEPTTEEQGIKIEKSKKFAIKPMDPEEAAMEMELLGHSFYVFRNSANDAVNVVYKRKENTYGLIEPEL